MTNQFDKLGELLKDAIQNGELEKSNSTENTQNNKIKKEKSNKNNKENKEKNKEENNENKEKIFKNNVNKSTFLHSNVQEYLIYYKMFNLKYGCSKEELKNAYRELLKKYHPDNFAGFPETQKIAERKTRELIKSYKKLLDFIG